MSKLFKNSKQIMALVMAFAILAVSLFAGSIVASAEDTESLCVGTRIEYWDGTSSSSFTKGDGTENNPYIIENAKQLNWVCTGSNINSEGKYYKVDPAIKAFILQPQTVVTALGGDDAFINVASAAETKELFEVKAAGQTLKNWLNNHINCVFAGNFDGSGVAIYGLYADDALKGSQQCGLFPIVDGNGVDLPEKGVTETPTVIKNFAVKNSYFKGARRLGAIVSTSWYDAGGTKINGFVNAEYIEVANCFLVGQDKLDKDGSIHTWNASNRIAEMGVAFGSMGNDTVRGDHISIYGNTAEYRMYGAANATNYTVDATLDFNRAFASNTFGNTNPACGELHNSIVLGAVVNGMQSNNEDNTYVSNVYTDVKTSQKGVTVVENGFGAEGQAAMEALDWENDWFMGHYGPIFRSFHGKFSLVQTNTTHYTACEDCGYKSYGGEVKHDYGAENFDDEHKCLTCEYVHIHTNQTIIPDFQGDCVTPPGYFIKCEDCLAEIIKNPGVAPGHDLDWVKEIYANCEKEGRAGYWHCKTCNCNFVADSKEEAMMAPMDANIANPETDLITPIAPHNATNHETGEIKVVQVENKGHYWLCVTCEGKLLAVEKNNYAEEDQIKKHKYEDGVCVDCGWECPEHNYQPSGYVIKVGSCTEDRVEELKCTNCSDKKTSVTVASHNIVKIAEVAATEKLEGTKEHYACTVCKEMYTDAEGKTLASTADLVIPKPLPENLEEMFPPVVEDDKTPTENDAPTNSETPDDNDATTDDDTTADDNTEVDTETDEDVNADDSETSPITGQNVASIIALAAIAGTALVVTRKIKK